MSSVSRRALDINKRRKETKQITTHRKKANITSSQKKTQISWPVWPPSPSPPLPPPFSSSSSAWTLCQTALSCCRRRRKKRENSGPKPLLRERRMLLLLVAAAAVVVVMMMVVVVVVVVREAAAAADSAVLRRRWWWWWWWFGVGDQSTRLRPLPHLLLARSQSPEGSLHHAPKEQPALDGRHGSGEVLPEGRPDRDT